MNNKRYFHLLLSHDTPSSIKIINSRSTSLNDTIDKRLTLFKENYRVREYPNHLRQVSNSYTNLPDRGVTKLYTPPD